MKRVIPSLFLVFLILIAAACSSDKTLETDFSATAEATVISAAEQSTATPFATATNTATPSPTPQPSPSPTPFPEPNDAEYNMLTCKAVEGIQGFVSFDASQEGVLEGLQNVVEPAFYAIYEGSDDLLHNVWSHFYQQVGSAPTDSEGNLLPYGAFSNTNYDICLKRSVNDADIVGANLIIPQVQPQEVIDAACKNPNANGFLGYSQATAVYVPEDGILATEFLAKIEISDCYSFISGVQTPVENAIANLINQYANPIFELNPADSIPKDALLSAGSYSLYFAENDIFCDPNPPIFTPPVTNPYTCYNYHNEIASDGHVLWGHDYYQNAGEFAKAPGPGKIIETFDDYLIGDRNVGGRLTIDHGCFAVDGIRYQIYSQLGHGDPMLSVGEEVLAETLVMRANSRTTEIEWQVFGIDSQNGREPYRRMDNESYPRFDPFYFIPEEQHYTCNFFG